MKNILLRLLGATALSTMSFVAFADGLDPSILTEYAVTEQISQLATASGTTATSAYAVSPEWSDELGFSATGRVGFSRQENSAIGLIVTAGERKREVLLNFGLALDAERQLLLTAGQLQERIEFGTAADQEWLKQNEFGIAYETSKYAFSVYQVDSETTDNFVGAKSAGAELSGSVYDSEAMTVGFGAGYQKLEWDDGSEGVNGLTARVDFGYQANSTTRFNVFADHNMSENQFGISGSWALGAGALNASYTFIDGHVGAVTNDQRIAVTYTMPIGGRSTGGVTRNTTRVMSSGALPSSTLLADVMRRPDYLPERVIVKAKGESCTPTPSDVVVHDFYFYDDTKTVSLALRSESDLSAYEVSANINAGLQLIFDRKFEAGGFMYFIYSAIYQGADPQDSGLYHVIVGCNTFSKEEIYID